ncbi:MAG: AI-2E family transporter [Chitinophagaceae bacterium]
MKQEVVFPFYARLAFILIILLLFGYFAILGERIIIPLLFSFLFAVLLLPAVNFMENKLHFSRTASSIVAVLLFVIGLFLLVYVIAAQIGSMLQDWPLFKSQMRILFYNMQLWLNSHWHIDIEKQLNYINSTTESLSHSGTAILGKTVLSLSSLLLFLVFIFLYTFFMLLYRRLLVRFITVAFEQKAAPIIADIIIQVKHIIRSYVVGLFFEMLIVSAVAITVFLMLGIKYAFLLGLIVGVFNVVPYVGIFTALVISALVTIATSIPIHAVYVAITVVIIHLVDSNFLMPKIVGSHVQINPLIVVLGVVVGELLWGISGMFLAIPYLAITKVVFDRIEGLQPWGILLGDEEKLPARARPLNRWLKKKTK